MSENMWIVLIVVAICSYLAVKVWVNARQAEREAFYRSEMVKKIADAGGWAAAQDFLHGDEKKSAQRRKQAVRLGGMITAASGFGLTIFLYAMLKGKPVYLAGLIPAFVGIALVVYSITSASRE